MTLDEAIIQYENKLNEANKSLDEKCSSTSIADQYIIGTLKSNIQEYSHLVNWLRELKKRREKDKQDH